MSEQVPKFEKVDRRSVLSEASTVKEFSADAGENRQELALEFPDATIIVRPLRKALLTARYL